MAEYADRKRQGMGSYAPSFFHRSNSIHSSSSDDKQSYSLHYGSPMFQRNGSVKKLHTSTSSPRAGNSFQGKVKKFCFFFESQRRPPNSHSLPLPSAHSPARKANSSIRFPGTEDRVVIYFTSLRGIRRTFQDCHSVRMIFRGFRANIDERDIAMDVAYRTELEDVLGEKDVSLPQVFIKGNHVGGSDAVRHLFEVGDLARLVRGLPQRSAFKPCDACNDARFIPCTTCNGSRKVFDEDEEQQQRCPNCNENGLLRCPLCCF